ncbi:MAG: NAD(P)H-dependent oxidoreductase subunit E [Gemmatimonadetes bacterium]|nr:NAD(P)H-dependent oxidoreductase subunit E [Gemmatimonadota bacterium]
MMKQTGAPFRNPGWAGETGDFQHLTESDIRGTAYVGARPVDGGHPGVACSYPYQLEARNPEAPLFEGGYRERLQKILSRYPDKRAALLPVLNLAHEIRGHLSAQAMEAVAGVLGVTPAYVRGVATFYTMYNKRPVGRFLVQVCTNVSCNLCGADDVLAAFLGHTGTEPGETSADGRYTVIEVECLGACGFPTAVQINDRYYENVSAADVPRILEWLGREPIERPLAAVATGAGAVAEQARGRARGRRGSRVPDPEPEPQPQPQPEAGQGRRPGK